MTFAVVPPLDTVGQGRARWHFWGGPAKAAALRLVPRQPQKLHAEGQAMGVRDAQDKARLGAAQAGGGPRGDHEMQGVFLSGTLDQDGKGCRTTERSVDWAATHRVPDRGTYTL